MRTSIAFLLMMLAACGDDGGVGEKVDPSDVTTADLFGTWVRDLDGTTQRVIAFAKAGAYHPAIATEENVMVLYDFGGPLNETLRIAGTYVVDEGVIVQHANWTDELGFDVEFGNDILSLERKKKLVIKAADGTRSEYRYLETCELPEDPYGWRTYHATTALYLPFDYADLMRTTLGFADDNLVAAVNGMVFRYTRECVPESIGTGGISEVRSDGQDAFAYLPANSAESGPFVDPSSRDSALTIASRDLPTGYTIAGDKRVIDGVFVMLASDGEQQVMIRDLGDAYDIVPITIDGFTPLAIVPSPDGIALVGSLRRDAAVPIIVVATWNGTTFTTEETTISGTSIAAAAEGDDLWLVHNDGSLKVEHRHGSTWTTTILGDGIVPSIALHDGVAHIVSAVDGEFGPGLYYSRVGDGPLQQFIVEPFADDRSAFLDPGHGLPADIAVRADGRVAIGYQGKIAVRDPDAASTAEELPLDIVIEGTGTVKSLDGSVTCTSTGETETCSVMLDPGMRYLFAGSDPNNPELGASWAICPTSVNDGICPVVPVAATPGGPTPKIVARFSGKGMRKVTPLGMQVPLGSAVARASGGWLMAGNADCQCVISLPGIAQALTGDIGSGYVSAVDASGQGLFLRKVGNGFATETASGKTYVLTYGNGDATLDGVTVPATGPHMIAFELDPSGTAVAGRVLPPQSHDGRAFDAFGEKLVYVAEGSSLFESSASVDDLTATLPFVVERSTRLADRVALTGSAQSGYVIATLDASATVHTLALPSSTHRPAIGATSMGLVALIDVGGASDLSIAADEQLVVVHLDDDLAVVGTPEHVTLLAQPLAITEHDGALIAVAGTSTNNPAGLAFAKVGDEPDVYMSEGLAMLQIDGGAQNRFIVFQTGLVDWGVGAGGLQGAHAELVWGP